MRRKALYDQRTKGNPYAKGNMAWLYSPAVVVAFPGRFITCGRRRSKCLNPIVIIISRGSAGTNQYRLYIMTALKSCTTEIRFENGTPSAKSATREIEPSTYLVGSQVEVIDEGEDQQGLTVQPHYPARSCQPPDHYGGYLQY